MTTSLPRMNSFAALLQTALSTSTATVTEGSRRNARDALRLRDADAEAARRLLAAVAPAESSRAARGA